MFKKVDHRAVPRGEGPDRSRATTAGTSSTGTPTGWRSASAASCAPGPARPTRSSSRARDNTEEERSRPGERYGRVYQINYLRCIFCGLCIEACPTRALTMTNEYELADDNRADLIYEKQDLLAPLLPGHGRAAAPDGRRARPRRDYYLGKVTGAVAVQSAEAEARELGTRTTAADGGDGVSTLALVGPPATPARRSRSGSARSLAVAGALGMLLSRKAVHTALCHRR